MSIEEFMSVFRQIINEFRILNEHFDSKSKSKTVDYDVVFSSWTKDMSRRYHEIPLNMHWGTSSPHISKNQILFDSRFKDEYNIEIKYRFDERFIQNFAESHKTTLDLFLRIVKSFQEFNDHYDLKQFPTTEDYNKIFPQWKKEISSNLEHTAIDYHWGNKLESIVLNPIYLTIMFQDDFLFEVKYKFFDENEKKNITYNLNFDDDVVI